MMTSAELIASCVIDVALDNDMFCEAFCMDCPAGKGGPDYECPAAWCPDSNDCYRADNWSDFCKGVTACFEKAMTH